MDPLLYETWNFIHIDSNCCNVYNEKAVKYDKAIALMFAKLSSSCISWTLKNSDFIIIVWLYLSYKY